jgi:nitroimidazol reductase NimA-like FMN-containing flavoprotein (pyridoxamine 5'-phosphate oxidase superfamily)
VERGRQERWRKMKMRKRKMMKRRSDLEDASAQEHPQRRVVVDSRPGQRVRAKVRQWRKMRIKAGQ